MTVDRLMRPWRWHVSAQVLAGIVLGLASGFWASATLAPAQLDPFIENVTQPLGVIFLRLIFMVTIPLIASSIMLGIVEMRDLNKLGKVGLQTLGFTLLLAATAVAIGLTMVNVLRPGDQISPELRDNLVSTERSAAGAKVDQARQAQGWPDVFLNLISPNPLADAVQAFNPGPSSGGLLAVMIAALIVGVAMAVQPAEGTATLKSFLEEVFRVAMTVISFAMVLAPFCVMALAFGLAARLGTELFSALGLYVVAVLGGLLLHCLVTYPLVLWAFSKLSPLAFFRGAQEALLVAFGTSSSNATLPTSLRVAETRLGVPRDVSRLVLTVGATGNQNGTALFEGITVLFLAQVYGVELSLLQQCSVALASVLAGVGTAGVPGGSLPLIVGVLATVGVPGEAIALVLGIDRFLDMCRTVVNVAGDLIIATCVGNPDTAGAPGGGAEPVA